jgi:hypothetical protein
MSEPRLHRRQFVIGPSPLLAGDDWVVEKMGPAAYLSRCPELPVERITDSRGIQWRLLGVALQSDPDAASPAVQLTSARAASPLDAYASWSGRWILASAAELHPDAGGTLGCFYRTVDSGVAVEVWASSSPALLVALPGRARLSFAAPQLHHGKGMDWYPPPSSRFAAVKRLLPTQILRLDPARGERVLPRSPLIASHPASTDEQRLSTLQRRLVGSLAAVAQRGERIWLPLTAGVDSRVILAGAKHVGLPLTTYTQTFPLMPADDRALARRLAASAGYAHEYIDPSPLSRSRRALFDAHTARHCVDIDRRFFSHGQWDALGTGSLILRGGVFEIGRCYYHSKFPGSVDDLFEAIAQRFHVREFHPSSFAHLAGIAEWVDWIERTPCLSIDWRDRLYLEQRIGGWVSSVEQALDLTGSERVYVANSHAYMAAVLGLPEETRRRAAHHMELIRRLAPELLELPFNPGDGGAVVLARRVRDEWREFAARPRKFRYVPQRGARLAGSVVRGALRR